LAFSRPLVRLIVALSIVALTSVVFGWTSTAGGVSSTVTIKYEDGAFSGTVQAASPCQAGRSVSVRKVKSGKTVGTTTTDSSGNWSVAKKRARGKFTATVSASTVTSGGTGYGYGYSSTTCDADTSDTIKVKGKKRGGGGGGGGGPAPGPGGLERFFQRLQERLDRLFGRMFQ
jgi:hypothetical protein